MKIFVSNEQEKNELIKVSKYLHDFIVFGNNGKSQCLDNDIMFVNFLMNLYQSPETNIFIDPILF